MIPFTKAHAYGNDFLYVRAADVPAVDAPTLAVEMCHRTTGAGADGLVIYVPTEAGATMRLFNADGSRAEVSGNGVRALAALLARDQPDGPASLVIDTEGGRKTLARLQRDGTRQYFRADMGHPVDIQTRTVTVDNRPVAGIALNIGNPQFIVLGPLPSDAVFGRLGAALEWHEAFPGGTNIEFAEVVAPHTVRIRIWERGCGPTSSSGTGSCASLVAAAAYGGADREATVEAPGGSQRVEWTDAGVFLTGWAEVLYTAHWLRPLPLAQ